MTVNGLIVPGIKSNITGKTYFGKIGIIYDGNVLIIEPHRIVFKGKTPQLTMNISSH